MTIQDATRRVTEDEDAIDVRQYERTEVEYRSPLEVYDNAEKQPASPEDIR